MALPVPSFFNLPAGNQPLSLLDAQFNAIAATGTIPCSAVGSNTLVLTPNTNNFVPNAYTNGAPKFAWIQPTTTGTGAVTISVSPLGALTAYKANGQLGATQGDLVGGCLYTAAYDSALSSGSGGFVVDVIGTGSGGAGAGVVISDTAPSSPTVGELWWDSAGGLLYLYYQDPNSSQWVNVNNYGAGTGGGSGGGGGTALAGAIQGAIKNLVITVPSATTVQVTADAVVVFDGTFYKTLTAFSATASTATVGANGLDAGAVAQATWYAVWVISGTAGSAVLLSTSSTAPTMPTGYTANARVGWVRTAPTATSVLSTVQRNRRAQYVLTGTAPNAAYPVIANGIQGTVTDATFTPVASSVATLVPPTASTIGALMWSSYPPAVNHQAFAPSPNFGGLTPASATSPPPPPLAMRAESITYELPVAWIVLEGTSVYYASAGASGVVSCMGWEDNL